MKIAAKFIVPALLLSLAFVAPRAKADDIVDTAAANPEFSTLVTAVKAAGLVDTLKGAGPFTVFAPTNAAFAKIPAKKLQALLKNKEALTAVLTYHVIPGKVTAADVMKLKSGTKVKTVEGSSIVIKNTGGVTIDKARVTKTDIECDNGVIHVIDSVLLPPDLKSKMGKM